MIEAGDVAPDFTVPLADGSISSFTLSENLDKAPLVLAFFPAAFSGTCTTEMVKFDGMLDQFGRLGATLYGASVDSPYCLNAFRDKEELKVQILSDFDREVIQAYDVVTDIESKGLHGLASRSVFIIDQDQTVKYAWRCDDLGEEPDYEKIRETAANLA
ncbi:MAG: redoxin domain-containing protein [Halobacteriaceae archaeon]